jgi:hypothetical protein
MMNLETIANGAQKSTLTDIRDAQAMKRMGLPLNTQVETRTFDKAISKHWMRIANAENEFDSAMAKYIDGAPAQTARSYILVTRRIDALYKAASDAWKFVEHYDKDPMQWQLLAELIRRALEFVEWWREAFVDAGDDEGAVIILDEAPRVFPAAG